MSDIEYVSDLVQALPATGEDVPLYARTPHGTHRFVIDKVERVEHEGEDVAVLVLRAVEW